MRMVWITLLLTVIIDQASKYGVLYGLDLAHLGRLDIWPPFMVFQIGWNRGINFGLFAGGADVMRWVLIAISLLIIVVVISWVWTKRTSFGFWMQISAGLLVGGALGNVIDRLRFGAVFDFINMSCCGINNPYIFNVADVAIFAGVIGLWCFNQIRPRDGQE